ncbi:hypothetical protein ACFPOI_31030 [Nonomuraea angiospora]|uniref:MFS family permease n=1 Tax=Nonomuraea angiospora TaxID=46172 RepID=A0ABR9LV29_9ACTN|nr:hypothetical protein [Nonomuraea angiospora]MBE1584513.1 MFS family permease [Nonomuraea angiospora]
MTGTNSTTRRSRQLPGTGVTQLLSRWPWRSSGIAGGAGLALMLLLYAGTPLRGIALASATNMAAVLFFLVGGVVLAAGAGAGAWTWRLLVRPFAVAAIPAVACWCVIVLLRIVILTGEPLSESVFQDGLGRAVVVYQASVLAGIASGAIRWVAHRLNVSREG